MSKITVSKGITPKNAAFLIKATFNQLIAYGLEITPIINEYIGINIINQLEII